MPSNGRVQGNSDKWKWMNRLSRMPEAKAKSGVTNGFFTWVAPALSRVAALKGSALLTGNSPESRNRIGLQESQKRLLYGKDGDTFGGG
jgi:hypothetical protein